MLNYQTQALTILPGEGYKIYQEDDKEVAVIIHTGVEMKIYKPTTMEIQTFASIYNVSFDEVIKRLM